MISRGEDVEAHALKNRGWSISAIARHLGRDRKTIRADLNGEREAGVRRSSAPDPLAPYTAYLAARFADNAHIWGTALFDEVVVLGYDRSYVSFARQVRVAGLRPHCEACAGVVGRETIEIDHPAGDEIQWDWFIESDVFDAVDGDFDLIVFDPPLRWFQPRDLLERAFADDNYASLTRFMGEVSDRLRPGGEVLVFFGTSGDVAYLDELIDASGLRSSTIAERSLHVRGETATYFVRCLTG